MLAVVLPLNGTLPAPGDTVTGGILGALTVNVAVALNVPTCTRTSTGPACWMRAFGICT
jgi:hypothetical protein